MTKTKNQTPSCAACGRPIEPNEVFYTINTPNGPKTVHHKCMEKK